LDALFTIKDDFVYDIARSSNVCALWSDHTLFEEVAGAI
jgi:hypothetical protein